MKKPIQPGDSQVFVMRIWVEEEIGAAEQVRMRGKVQHILGEEVHSFEDWVSMVDAIRSMLATSRSNEPGAKAAKP